MMYDTDSFKFPHPDAGPHRVFGVAPDGRLWVITVQTFHVNADTSSWVPEDVSAELGRFDNDKYVLVARVPRQKLYHCWSDIFESWNRLLLTGQPPTLRSWVQCGDGA